MKSTFKGYLLVAQN